MNKVELFDVKAAVAKILSNTPAEVADSAEVNNHAGSHCCENSKISKQSAENCHFGDFMALLADKSREGFGVHFYADRPDALAPVYPEAWRFDQRLEAQRLFIAAVDFILEHRDLVLRFAIPPTEVWQ